MKPALPRTSFNSSRLIRFLADLDIVDGVDSKQTFAERLSLWMDWTDAISLCAALNGENAARPSDTGSETPSPAPATLEELIRVRRDLAHSITRDSVSTADKAGRTLPKPASGVPIQGLADYATYRGHYLAHQRAMEVRIGTLRVNVRATLSGLSPGLARLAALDAVLDKALAARERHLLATVPTLLERHFERLRKAHQEALAPMQGPDDPGPPVQPKGWLDRYCRDMQGVLLAELEIRLQPIEGMMEALNKEATGRR